MMLECAVPLPAAAAAADADIEDDGDDDAGLDDDIEAFKVGCPLHCHVCFKVQDDGMLVVAHTITGEQLQLGDAGAECDFLKCSTASL